MNMVKLKVSAEFQFEDLMSLVGRAMIARFGSFAPAELARM